jgi:hypothetical protein
MLFKLVLLVSSIGTMSAAPRIIHTTIAGSGIELLPGTSQEFINTFTDVFGPGALHTLEPIQLSLSEIGYRGQGDEWGAQSNARMRTPQA